MRSKPQDIIGIREGHRLKIQKDKEQTRRKLTHCQKERRDELRTQ